jgi:hypothetical protein
MLTFPCDFSCHSERDPFVFRAPICAILRQQGADERIQNDRTTADAHHPNG